MKDKIYVSDQKYNSIQFFYTNNNNIYFCKINNNNINNSKLSDEHLQLELFFLFFP